MKISDYLSSGEAAEMLGVTKRTLKNWDESGKLMAYKHPLTGFKLYKLIDINNILKALNESPKRKKKNV